MRKLLFIAVIICAVALAVAQSSTTLFLSAPAGGSQGEEVELIATVLNDQNEPLANMDVDFILDEQSLGTASTDSLGSARKMVELPSSDATVEAVFEGDRTYALSSDSAVIEVSFITAEESCSNYLVDEDLMGTCMRTEYETTCADPPQNTSCSTQEHSVEYSCMIGTQSVQKQRCKIVGYTMPGYHLDIQEYACTASDTELVCDSLYDGDGSGTCSSGETCMRFRLEGDSLIREERNSNEEFQSAGKNFFLERVAVEVLQ